MKKILMFLVVTLLVVLLVLAFAKDIVAKTALSTGVRTLTGLKLDIADMDVGILKTLIGIRGMKLFNPSGYTEKVMVDMPEIYVDYDLGAFLRKEVHLEELRINLREFVVVKDRQGRLNLDSLKAIKSDKRAEPSKGETPPIQIDLLRLKIGKVIYKDYSGGGRPVVQEFNVNLEEEYRNITDPKKLAGLIVYKALVNTTIANLANFDMGALKQNLTQTLDKASKVAEQLTGKTLEKSLEVFKKSEDAAKEAGEAIKNIFPFKLKEE